MLKICSQRSYLMRKLRNQGLTTVAFFSSSFEFQVAKFDSWAKHELQLHLQASVGNASARHSRGHPGTIISPYTGVENRDYASANKPDPRTTLTYTTLSY